MNRKWLIILMFCFVAIANADPFKVSKFKVYETELADDGGTTNIIYKNKDGKKVRMTYYPPFHNDEVGVFEYGEVRGRGGELLERGDPRIKEFATELKKWVGDFYGENVFEEVLNIEDPIERGDFHVNIVKEKGIKFQKGQSIELMLIAHFYEVAMGPPKQELEDRKKWEERLANRMKIQAELMRSRGSSEQEIEKSIDAMRRSNTSPAALARDRYQKSQKK